MFSLSTTDTPTRNASTTQQFLSTPRILERQHGMSRNQTGSLEEVERRSMEKRNQRASLEEGETCLGRSSAPSVSLCASKYEDPRQRQSARERER